MVDHTLVLGDIGVTSAHDLQRTEGIQLPDQAGHPFLTTLIVGLHTRLQLFGQLGKQLRLLVNLVTRRTGCQPTGQLLKLDLVVYEGVLL